MFFDSLTFDATCLHKKSQENVILILTDFYTGTVCRGMINVIVGTVIGLRPLKYSSVPMSPFPFAGSAAFGKILETYKSLKKC